MKIFYFTATGNSLAVAKQLGGDLISIPQIIESASFKYKDDVIGVVFPIYGFSTPKMVRRFIDNAKFEADYIFAIGTYGNKPGAAMLNLQKRANKNGFSFDYANHLLMLDNYLPIFEVGAEMEKLPSKKISEQLNKIKDDIKNRRNFTAPASLGFRALTAVLSVVLPLHGNLAQKYIVNENCNKCGTCVKICPANNISVSEKVTFDSSCEGCMACLHLCTKNAIHLKNEKSDKRWRNPDVDLKEIIEANNRRA
jgi:ferredoxin